LHAGGQGFKSPWLHLIDKTKEKDEKYSHIFKLLDLCIFIFGFIALSSKNSHDDIIKLFLFIIL